MITEEHLVELIVQQQLYEHAERFRDFMPKIGYSMEEAAKHFAVLSKQIAQLGIAVTEYEPPCESS